VTLDACACKRGFFTLRDCGNAATTSCSDCTRRICDEHAATSSLCVECAARKWERREDEDEPSEVIVARQRRHWYAAGDYQPVLWGTYDPYWTDTDPRWYDSGEDDDDGGGFGDS
jgi:hypothetical protein